jgi:hypothetical protein
VLLDPSDYLGSASLFIDRALRVHAARGANTGGGAGNSATASASDARTGGESDASS